MESQIIVITPDQLSDLINNSVSKAVSVALSSFSNTSQTLKPEYLTRAETKAILKTTYPTLRDWTKRGLLKSYTIGGRIFYKSEEIEKALQAIPNSKSIQNGK